MKVTKSIFLTTLAISLMSIFAINSDTHAKDEKIVDCSRYDPKEAKKQDDGRRGFVFVSNRTDKESEVKLYHPDGDGRPFKSWKVPPQGTVLKIDDKLFNVGGDWGIRINDSCVRLIRDVSIFRKHYEEGTYFRVHSENVLKSN